VEIAELRTELKTKITELRAELKAEIADLRSELRQAELRLEAKIEAIKADILNRIFGLILGTLGVNIVAIVGAMFAVAKARRTLRARFIKRPRAGSRQMQGCADEVIE
jgi:hypothetical protein